MTNADIPDLSSVLAEKQRLETRGRLHWLHWSIIMASVLMVVGAWYYAKSQHNNQVRAQFEREATQTVELISERLRKYEDTLWAGVATIAANNGDVDYATWKKYSRSLNIETAYPGINGIGVIFDVKQSELEAYLEAQRLAQPGFKVFPPHEQPDRFPITYIEPVESNNLAVGLDMAHETNRYTAAKLARDTGKAQITGPIILVQDSLKTPGFLFYAPFYKNQNASTPADRRVNFEGLVYAPFIFKKLMEGTLNAETRQVGIQIMDQGTNLFNDNLESSPDFDPNPIFKQQAEVDIYGRRWEFDIWSKQSFRQATNSNKPWVILLAGLIIDGLLLTLFLLLARSNRRAMAFANKMSAAQEIHAVHLDNIIETTVDGIMTLDDSYSIVSFNRACEDIFGYKASELMGRHMKVILPVPYDESSPKVIGGKRENQTIKILGRDKETVGLTKGGVSLPLEVSVSEINTNGRKVYNTVVRDITKRKEAEAAVNRLIEDLKLSNTELEKFAYVASHDLKSPLRAIDNLSKWIEEDVGQNLDKENKHRIKLLRGRVARMDKLLDSLLEYSRAGGMFDGDQELPIATLIEDVREVIDIPAGFKFIVEDILKDIKVTRMPLEQILHNLINNAIKHHHKRQGTITISGTQTEDFYEVSIADDGPGIAPEFQEKIFDMFQTLRRRDEVEGSGMGLSLVKKIIHLRGGKISVHSDIGEGSVFKVSLPKMPRALRSLDPVEGAA